MCLPLQGNQMVLCYVINFFGIEFKLDYLMEADLSS